LFKKGDPLVLDNYRPIPLLNFDLKLLSYVLAQRLKKVLEKIVNNDQTGYILLYKVLTQIINDSLNPKCFKVVKINVHSSESNAFLKSTKTIAPSTL
jgi:hypothetical protein